MILNVSSRTDIIAFYSKWFLNRLKEGYFDVRNPFYPKKVSRIYLSNVDGIIFTTKNPLPIIDKLDEIKVPFLFHITLTPYKKDIEPNVPPKGKIIDSIRILSKKIGKDKIWVRYDPIFINDYYTIDYHIKNFNRMCELLFGYVDKIIISFLDIYQNVRYNMSYLRVKTLTSKDYEIIGINFSSIAKKYNMTIQTCCEKHNLKEYGFLVSDCITNKIAYELTGNNKIKKGNVRNNKCNCVNTVDIGFYNTCNHMCKYCYANYDENKVKENILKHNSLSSLLIGELKEDDIILERVK